MKRAITILLLGSAFCSHAQTAAEWTKQKKTQIKYLTEQIAALKVYTGYLQKGYSIAKQGLNTIGDIKQGDFNLHNTFFSSLKAVNPKVKNYARVADVIACQINIIKIRKASWKYIKESRQFTPAETDYIYSVFTKVLKEAATVIDQLTVLLTDGVYEMKDDERLQRIDAIYNDIQNKYAFVRAFDNEAKILVLQRAKERKDIRTLEKIYNIKK